MGESKLTIEEEAEIKKEIDRLQHKREMIGQFSDIMRIIAPIGFTLTLLMLLISLDHKFNINILAFCYDSLISHPWLLLTILGGIVIYIILSIISIILDYRGEKSAFNKIVKLHKIIDKKEGNFADYENEKLKELKHQFKVIWYTWLPFMILTAISVIFSGQFGIKIESESPFLDYLTSICQNKSYQIIIVWTIFSPCIILGFAFLFKDKAVSDFEKKLAQNAPPAEISGSGMQG